MNPNLRAFLAVIRAGEGTADAEGYRRHFGGELFDSFADHPRRAITKTLAGKPLTSTAAGAYQFLSRTWDDCARRLQLPDFSPASQDTAAEFLIKRRGALDDVLAGRVEQAIAKCAREWASLPGSPYGQPVKTMAQCLATYARHGGTFADVAEAELEAPPEFTLEAPPEAAREPAREPAREDAAAPAPNYTPPEAATMPLPALIAALLPVLAQKIPDLVKLAAADTKDERTAQAQAMAVSVVTEALGATNAQEAAEKVASDPAAAQVARDAVRAQWVEITDIAEAGGGGIASARSADAQAQAIGRLRNSPSFWIGLALLPLVYLIVLAVVGLVGSPFSDDVRAAIANGVVGLVLGGLIGYYFGQTTSSNRTR